MLNKLLRIGEGRMVKRLDAIASHVEALSDEIEALTDDEVTAGFVLTCQTRAASPQLRLDYDA